VVWVTTNSNPRILAGQALPLHRAVGFYNKSPVFLCPRTSPNYVCPPAPSFHVEDGADTTPATRVRSAGCLLGFGALTRTAAKRSSKSANGPPAKGVAEPPPGLPEAPTLERLEPMTTESKSPKFSAEVRDRAVRMVSGHRTEHASQWAAIVSIAAKIGCTAQTLCNCVRQAERDQGKRPGTTTDCSIPTIAKPRSRHQRRREWHL
jgi:transposase-like protein